MTYGSSISSRTRFLAVHHVVMSLPDIVHLPYFAVRSVAKKVTSFDFGSLVIFCCRIAYKTAFRFVTPSQYFSATNVFTSFESPRVGSSTWLAWSSVVLYSETVAFVLWWSRYSAAGHSFTRYLVAVHRYSTRRPELVLFDADIFQIFRACTASFASLEEWNVSCKSHTWLTRQRFGLGECNLSSSEEDTSS